MGVQKLKEKRKQVALGTVVWECQKFHNSARTDGLQLSHWIKCLKDSSGEVRLAEPGPYHFAKYDKKVRLCTKPWIVFVMNGYVPSY